MILVIQSEYLDRGGCEFVDDRQFTFIDFDELQIEGDVVGRVESIEPAPAILAGPGRVVLSTIKHLCDAIFRLTLTDPQGKSEKLGVTAPHRFYRESRGWIRMLDLQEGGALCSRALTNLLPFWSK